MEATKVVRKKKVIAPKLRFKDFKDKWNLISIGDYTTSSAFGPRFSSDLYSDSGNVLTLRTTDMDNEGNICYNKLPLANLNLTELKDHLLTKDDLVISRSGTIGVTGIFRGYQIPVIPGAFLIRFRFKKNELSPDFIRLYFNSQKGRNELVALSAGGVQKNLTGSSVLKMILSVPEFLEQQKITNFLSAVDEKLQLLIRKKELLEQYKTGVMQQIFSGKLRFNDESGKGYPKWEEKRLGDLLSYVVDNRGKTPPIADQGYPMIEINAIGKNTINYSVIEKFVSEETYNTWFRKYLEPGDILFSTVGATALCSIYDSSIVSVIAQNLVGLRFKSENELFMFYLLTEDRNNHKFKKIEMGAVQPSVKVSQMININFSVPLIEEQKKIADFLSAIDIKIENVNKQITQTQTFKKGLLQQMFV